MMAEPKSTATMEVETTVLVVRDCRASTTAYSGHVSVLLHVRDTFVFLARDRASASVAAAVVVVVVRVAIFRCVFVARDAFVTSIYPASLEGTWNTR